MTFNPEMEISNNLMYKHFLRTAYRTAHLYSDDPKTKVGAILFKESSGLYQMVSRGANHLKPEVILNMTPQEILKHLKDHEWKNENMIHAEVAAIEKAKQYGVDTKNLFMAMPWVPCSECGDAIIDAKISKLVTHKPFVLKTPEKWWDSTNRGIGKLKNAGIEILTYDGKIDGVESTFNYEVWSP